MKTEPKLPITGDSVESVETGDNEVEISSQANDSKTPTRQQKATDS